MSTVSARVASGSVPRYPERSAAASLKNIQRLSDRMVEHYLATTNCRSLPDHVLRGEIRAVAVNCLRMAATVLDGRGKPTEDEKAKLAADAERWAREGVPIDTILHALHEGSKMAHKLVGDRSETTAPETPTDFGSRTVDLLNLMTTTVTTAYLHEYRNLAGEQRHAVHGLTSALLNGRQTTALARECGITLAKHYHLVAICLHPHDAEFEATPAGQAAGRTRLRSAQAELAAQCGEEALALMSIVGGTILIPSTSISHNRLTHVVHRLAKAVAVPITAVYIETRRDDIPMFVDMLHEMLRVAMQLRDALHLIPKTRLYKFDELAVEYQLTRPGPVRDSLAGKMRPLAAHPELLETLGTYLATGRSRQKSARRLHLHPNTIDYRLKRIAVMTGMDPSRPEGLWMLCSSLIAATCPATDT